MRMCCLHGPERVIITEGVTDCISLMEHGFPVVSPVTVQIREADWERLLPKLAGVKTVYICQDNEVSEAGMQGAHEDGAHSRGARHPARGWPFCRSARSSSLRGGASRTVWRRGSVTPDCEALEGKARTRSSSAVLLADAKIDVNEYFATGKTAADFEEILACGPDPAGSGHFKAQHRRAGRGSQPVA